MIPVRLRQLLHTWTHVPYQQSVDSITLELTMACNLGCNQCNRSCAPDQAPSRERMSVEQIALFLYESEMCKKAWKQVIVTGGEPTLHPNFLAIVAMLQSYKSQHSPDMNIRVTTNGHSENSRLLVQSLSDVEVYDSEKNGSDRKEHHLFSVAPCDCAGWYERKARMGCIALEQCGMALSRHGFYFCGAAAAIDRVFGFGLGIMELEQVTPKALMSQRNLCGYCGSLTRTPAGADPRAMSKSWQLAYEAYQEDRPELKLYGAI